MRAMIFEGTGRPLKLVNLPPPAPEDGQILIRVHACGVCRTDLHIIDGELPDPHLPLVLGHQIVGTVIRIGDKVTEFKIGDRVGVPWLAETCGECRFCKANEENLCEYARFTGYHVNGGFADYTVANAAFCYPIPDLYSSAHAAPLLCGGVIGYRAYSMTGDAKHLGFYGFGSSAHMITQLATHQGCEVYAFTREGDTEGQEFAKSLGAVWAGSSEEEASIYFDAAIIFAPVGELVPTALEAVDKAGLVVCAGIHMSDIPSFPYSILWEERILRSVTNLTRQDCREFLELAPKIPIQTQVTMYPLEQANQALEDLRNGKIKGTAVIVTEE
jgi:alcohol dehydrogenase, propanol-preferring